MIEPKHSIPLTTAITASTPGKNALIEALYSEAQDLFFDRQGKGTNLSRIRMVVKGEGQPKDSQAILARVVDNETGFFIELTGVIDKSAKAVSGPFLCYGKLYLNEWKNPQLSNTQTKIWR